MTTTTKLFSLLPILLFSACGMDADTSVVVFRTDNAIYAAADSQAGQVAGVCKFFKVGDVFFSLSGPYFPASREIVSRADVTLSNIRPSVKNFERLFSPFLQDALEQGRKETPGKYRELVHSGLPETDFVFFGMRGGTPIVAIASFHIDDSQGPVRVTTAPEQFLDGPHCPDSQLICGATMGYDKAIKAFVSKHPDWWRATDLAGLVRNFVQIEINDQPEYVGPPVRVLRIDAKGARWIQHGEGCSIAVRRTPL
jgi:hypothetical protein